MPGHKTQPFRPLPQTIYERPPSRPTGELRHPASNVRGNSRVYDDNQSRAPRRVPAPQPEYEYTNDYAIYEYIDKHSEPRIEAHVVELDSQDGDQYERYPGSGEIIEVDPQMEEVNEKALVVRQQREHRASSAMSDRSANGEGNGSGKGRKRRSNPATQAKNPGNRHPSEHRLGQAQDQPRITDSLNHGHSSRPQALPTGHATGQPGMTRQPLGPSKLRESTRFDTPSDGGKTSHGGSISRSAARSTLRPSDPIERGSPMHAGKGSKRRYEQIDTHSPRPPTKNKKNATPPSIKDKQPSAQVKTQASFGDLLMAADMKDAQDLFAESDEEADRLSSDDGTLDELIGDQTTGNTLTSGKLKLDMPKSLDHVIKKVIGPMIKRVVQDRGDVAAKVCDEWEWSRLEVLSAELNSTLDEARQKILGQQQERQGAFERAKNDRIEYESKTTGIYKEHGKDYRVLCNDLTGNNHRAVKKIKREIKTEPRSQSPQE